MPLFVGGIRDGDWFAVPGDRPFWTMREAHQHPSVNFDPNAPVVNSVIRQENYQRMHFRGDKETFTVYAGEGVTPDDVLRKLLENYKAPLSSEARNRKLSEVSRATIDAQLLGVGFLMVHPDNSFQHVPVERISIKPAPPESEESTP